MEDNVTLDMIRKLDFELLEREYDLRKYYPKNFHNDTISTPILRELLLDKPIYKDANKQMKLKLKERKQKMNSQPNGDPSLQVKPSGNGVVNTNGNGKVESHAIEIGNGNGNGDNNHHIHEHDHHDHGHDDHVHNQSNGQVNGGSDVSKSRRDLRREIRDEKKHLRRELRDEKRQLRQQYKQQKRDLKTRLNPEPNEDISFNHNDYNNYIVQTDEVTSDEFIFDETNDDDIVPVYPPKYEETEGNDHDHDHHHNIFHLSKLKLKDQTPVNSNSSILFHNPFNNESIVKSIYKKSPKRRNNSIASKLFHFIKHSEDEDENDKRDQSYKGEFEKKDHLSKIKSIRSRSNSFDQTKSTLTNKRKWSMFKKFERRGSDKIGMYI